MKKSVISQASISLAPKSNSDTAGADSTGRDSANTDSGSRDSANTAQNLSDTVFHLESQDGSDQPKSLEDSVYSQTTRNIRISVHPEFLANQSEPARATYAFQYTVTIENLGNVTVQLLSRHWRINSGGAEYMQVKGDGVVGEQPTLESTHGFRYTSGAVIKDPVGSMQGEYTFRSESGETFEVTIPRFDLIYPHLLH